MHGFLLALLCLFSLPAAWANPDEVSVPMQAVKLGAHSYFVEGLPGAASSENQGFMSNAGFVVTADGVVVFDALASPPLAEKLVGLIRADHPAADQAGDRQPLPRRPLLWPAGLQGTGRRNLGAPRRRGHHPQRGRGRTLCPAQGSAVSLGGRHHPAAGSRSFSAGRYRLRDGRRAFRPAPRRSGAFQRGHGDAGARKTACCTPAIWCFAAACPSSAMPTAAPGSPRSTS